MKGVCGSVEKVLSVVEASQVEFQTVDSDYLTTQPGLFPDPLEELGDTIQLIPFYWRSLWVDLRVPEGNQGGDFQISLSLKSLEGQLLRNIRVKLHVVDCCLPPQKLIHTEWFYSDCLADFYQVPVFGDRYWEIVENFMRTAVKRGVNMILTPLFTLPLDTLIGKERTTVQLVGVKVRDGAYAFDFSMLEKWVRLAEDCGFSYFEMGHLFSQWGAKYAPKVMADEDRTYRRIFGWETRADSAEYVGILLRKELWKCLFPPISKSMNSWTRDIRTGGCISAAASIRRSATGFSRSLPAVIGFWECSCICLIWKDFFTGDIIFTIASIPSGN